jgi:hypothetical protein
MAARASWIDGTFFDIGQYEVRIASPARAAIEPSAVQDVKESLSQFARPNSPYVCCKVRRAVIDEPMPRRQDTGLGKRRQDRETVGRGEEGEGHSTGAYGRGFIRGVALWPTAFALKELTAAEEARIGALVKKAVS